MLRIRGRYPTVWNMLIDIGIAGLLIYFVALLAVVRTTQVDGVASRHAAEATQAQILDCIEPTGDCYKQSQKRTGDLVGVPPGPLNTVTVLAAACAAGFADEAAADRVEHTRECVVDRLASVDK